MGSDYCGFSQCFRPFLQNPTSCGFSQGVKSLRAYFRIRLLHLFTGCEKPRTRRSRAMGCIVWVKSFYGPGVAAGFLQGVKTPSPPLALRVAHARVLRAFHALPPLARSRARDTRSSRPAVKNLYGIYRAKKAPPRRGSLMRGPRGPPGFTSGNHSGPPGPPGDGQRPRQHPPPTGSVHRPSWALRSTLRSRR